MVAGPDRDQAGVPHRAGRSDGQAIGAASRDLPPQPALTGPTRAGEVVFMLVHEDVASGQRGAQLAEVAAHQHVRIVVDDVGWTLCGRMHHGHQLDPPEEIVPTAPRRHRRGIDREDAQTRAEPAEEVGSVGDDAELAAGRGVGHGGQDREMGTRRQIMPLAERQGDEAVRHANTTVRLPLISTRRSRCTRTARVRVWRSSSRPLRMRSSTVSRCETRATACSMIGPWSSCSVT